jgi:hypothetical protein
MDKVYVPSNECTNYEEASSCSRECFAHKVLPIKFRACLNVAGASTYILYLNKSHLNEILRNYI